jgi:hypothetical protein
MPRAFGSFTRRYEDRLRVGNRIRAMDAANKAKTTAAPEPMPPQPADAAPLPDRPNEAKCPSPGA